jgi:hypothetical protein
VSERQKTLDDIANRIKTNPIGWLPTVGDVINVTFDIKKANLVASALKRDHLFEEMVAALEKMADSPNIEIMPGSHLTNEGRAQLAYAALTNFRSVARAILAKVREAGQ